MKVSVVVPLYNKGPWVKRSLQSLSAQTFSDFEVIVVDDGSTDGGHTVVEQHPDARFRLVRQANAGPGAARNRGIAEAKGEYLAFLDADDEWLPQFLEENVKALDEAGPAVAAVVCGYIEYPAMVSRERLWRRRGVREEVFKAHPEESPRRLVHLLAYMNPWATMVRAEVLHKYGGFFGRERCLYAEDAFLWLKVLLNEQVRFTLTPLVHFHTEASSLSKNLKGARPIEPFLKYPEELEASCPGALRPLLRQVLSIRASKTACMLSYWGRWQEAAQMLERYCDDRSVTQPYAVLAKVASTPVGAFAGRVWRKVLRRLGDGAPPAPQKMEAPAVPLAKLIKGPLAAKSSGSSRSSTARPAQPQSRA